MASKPPPPPPKSPPSSPIADIFGFPLGPDDEPPAEKEGSATLPVAASPPAPSTPPEASESSEPFAKPPPTPSAPFAAVTPTPSTFDCGTAPPQQPPQTRQEDNASPKRQEEHVSHGGGTTTTASTQHGGMSELPPPPVLIANAVLVTPPPPPPDTPSTVGSGNSDSSSGDSSSGSGSSSSGSSSSSSGSDVTDSTDATDDSDELMGPSLPPLPSRAPKSGSSQASSSSPTISPRMADSSEESTGSSSPASGDGTKSRGKTSKSGSKKSGSRKSSSGSGKGATTTSSATSSLIDLVQQQAEMVRSLTETNQSATEELRRVQEEKRRMEEQLRKSKELMQQRSQQEEQAASGISWTGSMGSGGGKMGTVLDGRLEDIPEEELRSVLSGGSGSRSRGSAGSALPQKPPPPAAAAPPPVTEWVPFEKPKSGGGGDGRETSRRVVFDEWSTVVYPQNIVGAAAAIATPIDEEGFVVDDFAMDAKSSKSHRSKKKKSKRKSVTVPPKPKTIPLVSTDCAPPLEIPTGKPSCSSKFWASFSRAVTCFIPNFCICRSGAQAKQAWREKVAICLLAVSVSAFFVGVFGFIPLFLCTEQTIYTWEDVDARNAGAMAVHRDHWTVIHGKIYDVKEFAGKHPGGATGVNEFVGEDASRMFPRIAGNSLPTWCLNPKVKPTNLTQFTSASCVDFSLEDKETGLPCHNMSNTLIGPWGIDRYLGKYQKGLLAHSHIDLHNQKLGFDWIVIRGRVYNLTAYTAPLKEQDSGKIVEDSPNAFLTQRLNKMVTNKIHSDATKWFEAQYEPEVQDSYLQCLEDLYFAGVVDDRDDPVCYTLNIIMYVMLILVLLILVLQFICSLMYVARGSKALTAEMAKSKVMIMVPTYNEGDRELEKTIKSLVEAEYPDENKVLLVVADGLITGRGEVRSTPETIAKCLGYTMDKDNDRAHSYRSIGASTRNRAFVYHGTYKSGHRELKYLVVVKCGTSKERSSPRAGNRGKRDSQLLLAGVFNRVHHGRELTDLDVAICRALQDLELSVEDLKYLMTIDADTRIRRDSMARMVHSMERDERQLACSGETRVDNKAQSFVTMIQVYEYFSSHHMKKAFESVFGCVTCLPGCFTMYRFRSVDGRPLLASDNVFGEYSRNDIESLHEKNLFHLGEDRMLTTLLLKYFPDMRLSFVPEAVCWTIVPHRFRVLLSQRRRWINSTFHNMWELLKVENMCGVCLFSMKTVVIADMIATMILPASFLYAGYFVYTVFAQGAAMSQTLFIIYGVIIGCQLLVFIIRSRWDFFLWFFMYFFFGVPLFFFVLPIYSFWNMDDLSWGQTRQVAAEKVKETPPSDAATAAASTTADDDDDNDDEAKTADIEMGGNEGERSSPKEEAAASAGLSKSAPPAPSSPRRSPSSSPRRVAGLPKSASVPPATEALVAASQSSPPRLSPSSPPRLSPPRTPRGSSPSSSSSSSGRKRSERLKKKEGCHGQPLEAERSSSRSIGSGSEVSARTRSSSRGGGSSERQHSSVLAVV